MSGIQFVINVPNAEIQAAISRFTDLETTQLLDDIGALVVSQTQRRIDTEKTGPNGEAWEPNTAGTETLVQTGALRDTIDHQVSGNQAIVGSPLLYAATHQFGATIVPKDAQHLVFMIGGRKIFANKVEIPARPFLGLSPDNVREIENLIGALVQ
ncbi:MAG: phage virion morphogenesis protein [Cohaesibacteraceae bacterium]|nr:phage virion morphogenesis protein [Cohaesibacteraceae bacterium]